MKKRFWKKTTALILTANVALTALPAFAVEDELVGIDADYVEVADDSEEFFEDDTVFFDDVQDEGVFDVDLEEDVFAYDEEALFDDELDEGLEAVTEGALLDDFSFEEDPLEDVAEEADETLAIHNATSGTCGENLTWTLGSEGTLIISGTGAMKDYYVGASPFSEREDIKVIKLGYGVTTIGDYAFWDCDSLTSITIPDSVTSIGVDAFNSCDGLTSITIPNSIWFIGKDAFARCENLPSITIPNSVTSIGESAFRECHALANIKVADDNRIFDSRNNCNAIIRTADNSLIQGCKNTVIPNSVTSIGESAFVYCKNLTSITIPDSVTNIGAHAFYACHGLTSITIPNSVTNIGISAFGYCNSLTSITIPDSVTSIGHYAFGGCDSLTSITIPSSVTTIGEDAFSQCTQLTIHGYSGSYAEQYAFENNIPFEVIGDDPAKPIIVVSLGDSYASGEGNEPFYGQDKPLDQKVKDKNWLAHRSEISWSGQLMIPGLEHPLSYYRWDDEYCGSGPECRWYFVASSGATTADIISKEQKKTVRQKGIYNHKKHVEKLPKQLDIFDEIKRTGEHVDYVTISIGGNDAQFADVIKCCVLDIGYVTKGALVALKLASIWGGINKIKKDIKDTYIAIKNKTSEDTIILVTGYPQLIDYSSWKTTGLAARGDEALMINQSVNAFNDIIESIVTDCRENENMKIYFVDIEKEFYGKQAAWINPIYLGHRAEDLDDKAWFSSYSVHPNAKGINAYVECVQETIYALADD